MTRHAAVVLSAAALLLPTVAFAESRTFDLAPFDEIEVSSGIKANVTVGARKAFASITTPRTMSGIWKSSSGTASC